MSREQHTAGGAGREIDSSITEIRRIVTGIRSLSGVMRALQKLRDDTPHFDDSEETIRLVTLVIERLVEFAGGDLKEGASGSKSFRALAELLLIRSTQYTVGGVSMKEGERDAREALRLSRQAKDRSLEAAALSQLGSSFLTQQKMSEAIVAFRQEVAIERETGNDGNLLRALYNLARALIGSGNREEARECVSEGLEMYAREGDPPGPLFGKAFLLQIWQDLHNDSVIDVYRSIAIARESIAILDELGMTDRLVAARLGLIRSSLVANDPVGGMEEILRIEEVVTPSSSPFLQCQYLVGLTAVHSALGEWGFAEETGVRGLELTRKIGNQILEGVLLERLAEIARRSGDPTLGLERAEQGLEIELQPQKRAFLLRLHADILVDLGRSDEARKSLEAGEELLEKIGQTDERGFFQLTRGRLLFAEGDFDGALLSLRRITELPLPADQMVTQSHEILSRIHQERGEMKEALEEHRRYHSLVSEEESRRRSARLLDLRAQHELRWEHQRVQADREESERQREELQKLAAEHLRIRERLPDIRRELARLVGTAEERKRKEIARGIESRLDSVAPGEEIDLLDHLRGVDPDFSRRLLDTWPNLTPGQIRLASLLRAGLRTPEICDLLDLTPETLQMQRKRLRKRLNLQPGESLEERIINT